MQRLWVKSWLPVLAMLAILGAAAAAYSPGLPGPFLLDDWGTLPKLGAYGPVNNPVTLVSYLTSGDAGPTGRPLSLATFLLNARNWPASPWSFKLTNVLVELLNGALLAALLTRLSKARGLEPVQAAWIGVLGAGFWVLHPLFVSTTLYVVQRMAELAATFVFAGLLSWVFGREQLAGGHSGRGYTLMGLGIGLGTLFGALSKENAALLPALALVLEATVFASAPAELIARTRTWLAFRVLFLWIPTICVAAFLLSLLRQATAPLSFRDFTIAQRLLTEPRVLFHYLYLLFIPHVATGGLFTKVRPSRGWLSPWTTLPSVVGVIAMVAFGWAMRRRWPIVCAAILFYFVGQAVESTTVPLELYFEHRNYLPAALLFWPIAWWLVRGHGSKSLRTALAVGLLVLLATFTGLRANLWGHRNALMLSWLQHDPHSPRAIVRGAQTLQRLGKPQLALTLLRKSSAQQPTNVSIALVRLSSACALREANQADVKAAHRAVATTHSGSSLIYSGLQRLEAQIARRGCAPLGAVDLLPIARAAISNPHFTHNPAFRQEFTVLEGKLELQLGHTRRAYHYFAQALPLDAKPATALVTASLLGAAGAPRLGMKLLQQYQQLPAQRATGWTMSRLHRWWLDRIGWYRDSFQHVRHVLESHLGKERA